MSPLITEMTENSKKMALKIKKLEEKNEQLEGTVQALRISDCQRLMKQGKYFEAHFAIKLESNTNLYASYLSGLTVYLAYGGQKEFK